MIDYGRRKTAMMRLAMGLVLVAATAMAAPGAAAAKKSATAQDAEREICRSHAAVGSRLKRVRVCMTAQQWEELKLQERLGLARKQINGDPGCNGGGPCGVERGGKDTPW
ncbi:MAG TPA: hypothetical protein VFZ91_04625 [Allosphingosinicella sp.]